MLKPQLSKKVASRPPGRRAGSDSEKVRQGLLDAARKLFLSYEFRAVSVRQIAQEAEVNPAMVNYYFGGKRGLYVAMVEQVLETFQILDTGQHDAEPLAVEDFISRYMQFLAENPWWPNFIIREVLFGEEKFRQMVAEKFAKTFAGVLMQAVDKEKQSGNYRSNLRADFAGWSLMGMMVFPFLTRPLAKKVFGGELDQDNIRALISHTCDLFRLGAGSPEMKS